MKPENNNDHLLDSLRETYNKYAQERDSAPRYEWKIVERENFLSLLQREQKKTLLEIGAGTGQDGKFFLDQGLDVTCVDLSPVNVEMCRQKGLTTFEMDMRNLQFASGSFDSVYAMNSMLHLPKTDFAKVLRRIEQILEPEGVFFLGIYGGSTNEAIWDDDPYIPHRFFSEYADEDLERVVVKVFAILSFKKIIFEIGNPTHFQSLTLRKSSVM